MKIHNNQKVVTVNKKRTSKDTCFISSKDKMYAAMKELKPTSFILYSYINSNQDGYVFALSQNDVIEKTGISRSAYFRGVQELVEKKYLVQVKEDEDKYIFTE